MLLFLLDAVFAVSKQYSKSRLFFLHESPLSLFVVWPI